jgi:hypothetical protein
MHYTKISCCKVMNFMWIDKLFFVTNWVIKNRRLSIGKFQLFFESVFVHCCAGNGAKSQSLARQIYILTNISRIYCSRNCWTVGAASAKFCIVGNDYKTNRRVGGKRLINIGLIPNSVENVGRFGDNCKKNFCF